jgi:hypothetical protein
VTVIKTAGTRVPLGAQASNLKTDALLWLTEKIIVITIDEPLPAALIDGETGGIEGAVGDNSLFKKFGGVDGQTLVLGVFRG